MLAEVIAAILRRFLATKMLILALIKGEETKSS